MSFMPSSDIILTRWFAKSPEETLEALSSGEHGLNEDEALRRLEHYGPNKLPEAKPDNPVIIFFRQFQSPLIYVLLGASGVVFALRQFTDGFVILFTLIFNAVVGAIQEGRSQNTLSALRKFTQTNAVVLRGGQERILPDQDVAPGDIVLLEEGVRVAADGRLVAANTLKIDEAALTGESEPVHKVVDLDKESLIKDRLPTAEQKNMVFKGTYVLSGNGRMAAVATGVNTVIGKIAQEVGALDTEIPLKTNMRALARLIVITVAAISALLFLLGWAAGKSFIEMFTTAVALSVSMIPEGLPIVLTLILATGVWRMSKRNALVKKLQAVEALGQARIIAVDKTGTITKSEMAIQKVYANGKLFLVGGSGYEPKGDVYLGGYGREAVAPSDFHELLFLGRIASFCSNARLSFMEETRQWRVSGDTTEAALLVFGEKMGFGKDDLERFHPLLDELPFDYKTKYHATVHSDEGGRFLSVVGAPEAVLARSGKIWEDGEALEMSLHKREELEGVFHRMSQEGLRTIAAAVSHNAPQTLRADTISSLTFVGFYGMKDALRPEVAQSVARAEEAGIKVVMITGDHKLTAAAIAREAGIFREGHKVITGDELEKLTDSGLDDLLPDVAVFARVTPEHKMKIIQAYKRRGEIVAMTGDGVNDAPSLVAADLGVAMGKIGTEVAKEAADIVLLDDNFGSIVAAIEEGRAIYKTIKKVILYLFSTSIGEALTIVGAIILGWPLPILPAQIIWLNLVTDGFLDVALAMEPKEKGLLSGFFERSSKYLVDGLMLKRMVLMAVTMMVGTLILFSSIYEANLAKAWTVALTVLAVFQWFNAWNCRSEAKSIFQMNPFSNKFLVGATITVVFLQLAAIYTPLGQAVLRTVPLALEDWLIIVPAASAILIVEEARKWFSRRETAVKSA